MIKDCHAKRLRLLFRVAPTPEQPAVPVLAYLHKYSSIPAAPENATTMFIITKPATVRTKIINSSRIFRVYRLSPRIAGPAIRGVTPDTALDSYDSFNINKYYSLSDFSFVNQM